jgi:hypothetical protein
MVEVIVAVGILAVGIGGVNLYMSTQPAQVYPQSYAQLGYTVLQKLGSSGLLTCSKTVESQVDSALYVLLPPSVHYNYTVYLFVGGHASILYSVANAGSGNTLYQSSVELMVDGNYPPAAPGSAPNMQPICFVVISIGEP